MGNAKRLAEEIKILAGILAKLNRARLEGHLETRERRISGLQYGLMQILCRKEYTLSELSRHMLLDPSTLVPVVDALEQKGLLRRSRDSHDRRRVPLSLTEHGVELLKAVSLSEENDPMVQAVQSTGLEKSEQLISLLRQFIDQMPGGADLLVELNAVLDAETDSTTG